VSTLSVAPTPASSAYKVIRVIEAVTASLFILGEMYFGAVVLDYKTTPWQDSWFSVIVSCLLILVGPLSCLLIWRLDLKHGRSLSNKIRRIETIFVVVGIVGSVALMMVLINIRFGSLR